MINLRLSSLLWPLLLLLWGAETSALRQHRSWSSRTQCEMAIFPNWPFAYEKFEGQSVEQKGRVNSNLQDFRHSCEIRGGRSKCHICEEIDCSSETGKCQLQLQGVSSTVISNNIPTVTDDAWAVEGAHRHDYGSDSTTHFCVFLSGGDCPLPQTSDFSDCPVRCAGHGFPRPPVVSEAANRTVIDLYDGQKRWADDGSVDLWEYPWNCTELNDRGGSCTVGANGFTPSFNPQGFTYTHAGEGALGFKDGERTVAEFNKPQDVAVDKYGNVYVADTDNHAIRKIEVGSGVVTTIAGLGPGNAGRLDGHCNVAKFSNPKGLDVTYQIKDGKEVLVIIVADTGNHAIRRIDMDSIVGSCEVKCLTGLCGNDSLSFTDSKYPALPYAGFADGEGLSARFSAPESVAFMDDGYIAVADTGNWLIRWVNASDGNTFTLAGGVGNGPSNADGKPVGGCPPPCLVGLPGYADGRLEDSRFYSPVDVTRGPNNTIYIVDEHRIRMLELHDLVTTINSVKSEGRVSTISGNAEQGYEDGDGAESTFFSPSGVAVTADDIAYVIDSGTCRVRRVMAMHQVSPPISCGVRGGDIIRPSGCNSYDQPQDKTGRKISRVDANLMYSYSEPHSDDLEYGKYIKNCVGVTPVETLQKRFVLQTGDNYVVDDDRVTVYEDSEEGDTYLVRCQAGCAAGNSASSYSGAAELAGDYWYSDKSSICMAAVHDGILPPNTAGFLKVIFARRARIWDTAHGKASTRNGLTSTDIADDEQRIFRTVLTNTSVNMVHTVAGHPSAPLENGCGFRDAQPPQFAYFSRPLGIAVNPATSLTDTTFLYVADTDNNRIRGVSAVCTQICENRGVCSGPDVCSCAAGWAGVDCTRPVCSGTAPANKLCVAPETFSCKPGFSGPDCDLPTCTQTCLNGGSCTNPDTCSCTPGWFDANCSTPVCLITCANGGNCTAPDECACPSSWKGFDCRTPNCEQTCLNGGYCVAPNTCVCPPQWSSWDCGVPVCTQGYFRENPSYFPNQMWSSDVKTWATFKQCNLDIWCNQTQEFECVQEDLISTVIELPSGGSQRAITGRRDRPDRCMQIELPTDYIIPFQLLKADGGTTPNIRYSDITPYENNPSNSWYGFLNPVVNRTGPWEFLEDRQIAYVQWLSVTQGVFVCANGGNCTSPDICECASGWTGFDCRTPICTQGYYFPQQKHYVSGSEAADELHYFEPFMGYNSYRREWPYSNPNYTMQYEFYVNQSYIHRETRYFGNDRYLGPANWSTLSRKVTYQGGYRCSVRSVTPWENLTYTLSHPNYYSRYMNPKVEDDDIQYTNWTGMGWPPLYRKSKILVYYHLNKTYVYTDEGWRLWGTWNRTESTNLWTYGTCLTQFYRNCSETPSKSRDFVSRLQEVYTQDTDYSFRARVTHTNERIRHDGRWKTAGGTCVDEVIRGCYNNGTCVGPDTCRCAAGWSGSACTVPVCSQTCNHNGNCTLPETCTCEKGWEGYDCSIPICAQECQNGGYCVAPDTCKCFQFPNELRDGRLASGRPLFRKPSGDPLETGWTGYDCSVPICVQAERFLLNTDDEPSSTVQNSVTDYVSLGGHGGDNLLPCIVGNKLLPRCPMFDYEVVSNNGKSFQSGCGYDPIDTGCCIPEADNYYTCLKCTNTAKDYRYADEHTMHCMNDVLKVTYGISSEYDKFKDFMEDNFDFHLCGKFHTPRASFAAAEAQYYFNKVDKYRSFNFRSNVTSNRFLCNKLTWNQGDYIDDAGLGGIEGAGSIYGLEKGRHIRVNTPNAIGTRGEEDWILGPTIYGEGIYGCYNDAACLAPDLCSCTDGYEGDDCATPICRHLQPTGEVTSCLNNGICVSRDECVCIQTLSVLYIAHTGTSRGVTGWTGSDCSIPMCSQGYFDPFCTMLPQAPGGEGCYRCANAGNCTAPDVCTCASGWTGFDCRTPVCEVVADPLMRTQLPTIFEDKIIDFESDPCAGSAIYRDTRYLDRAFKRGNCSQPNECTCLCRNRYDYTRCDANGEHCEGAWQDPMWNLRDLISVKGPHYAFGVTDCYWGFQGNMDRMDKFVTCHQTIYQPTETERNSIPLIVSLSIVGFFGSIFWFFMRRRLQKRYLLAKIERRRSRRSSEESLLQAGKGAFGHA
jgi:hypothetical protein